MDEKLKDLISDLNDLFENMDEYKSEASYRGWPLPSDLKHHYQQFVRELHRTLNEQVVHLEVVGPQAKPPIKGPKGGQGGSDACEQGDSPDG